MVMVPEALLIIGSGNLFERANVQWRAHQPSRTIHQLATAVDDLADIDDALLRAHLPERTRFFAAVDSVALNFARLDLFVKLRMLGYRADTFVHPQARVDDSADIGENSYVCEGAVIGPGARIGRNCFVGPGARIGFGAEMAASCWMDGGATCSDSCRLGTHSILGPRVHLAAGVEVGSYCELQLPGLHREDVPDRTFLHPLFSRAVRICSG